MFVKWQQEFNLDKKNAAPVRSGALFGLFVLIYEEE